MNCRNFEEKIDGILFSESYPDNLFKDGIKPYIKDSFRFKNAKRLLQNPEKKLIFDIGAYPGTSIYYFGEHNKIVGLGKTDEAFSNRISKCGHTIVDIDFETQDIPTALLQQADIVLMMEIIEHIRQPLKFLKKVTELLTSDGLLYLTTNNFSYIGYILKLLLNKSILDPIKTENTFYPGHCRYFLLHELESALKDFGFSIIHKKYINFLPDSSLYKNKLFGVVKNGLINLSPQKHATHIEILAQKQKK